MIDSFTGKYAFLSNFFSMPGRIKLKPYGTYITFIYDSVEHGYQAAKSLDINDRRAIQRIKRASDVKAYGKTIQLRPDWDTIRNEIMYDLLQQKFSITGLRKLLFDTGNQELIEGNYWHDTYWGKCTCKQHTNIGENNLGSMLMQIRKEIK